MMAIYSENTENYNFINRAPLKFENYKSKKYFSSASEITI